MKMLDSTMSFLEIDEAIAYMLPYLDNDERLQIKRELDENSIIFTKEQYNTLCSTLYSTPLQPEATSYTIDMTLFSDTYEVDMLDNEYQTNDNMDYLSIQPLSV
jgi:hypothetical protein